jgi:formylglycine-generating enzyme required for sulfatase activity
MTFNLKIWKEKTSERLGGWLERRKAQDVPYFLYGALCGASLWPLVEATQAGQTLPSMMALGSVAAGAGGNLLAEQVQRWKDEADEEQIARWVAEHAPTDPELRQALDAILARLDAVVQARVGLSETDRDWFTATLRSELAQLGNLARFEAALTGSDAIAQDHSVAASTGGVAVGRDVRGDVLPGVKVSGVDARWPQVEQQFSVAGDVYVGPRPQDDAEALAVYRRVLAQACGRLPLRGVDVGAGDPTAGQKPLGLAGVYVDLDTTVQVAVDDAGKGERDQRPTPGERETRPLSALQAVVANRRLALLGDPGGGKTTFVHHLAHCLAAGKAAHLPGWPQEESGVLPVLLVLRDFAAALPDPLPPRAAPEHLWGFISAQLAAQKLEFAADLIERALEAGRALLLLDGLDEVPTTAGRAFVRDAVTALLDRYHPDNRALVTCRVLSYQPPAPGSPDLRLRPADFPTFELAPFDEDKIDRFVAAWYEELARLGVVPHQEAPGLARQLRGAMRRPDLWRLAPNPLLLTVMALVHTHKGRLPDARALLYEETVDILLWRWEQVKAGGREDAPRLRKLLLQAGRTDVDLKRVLWRLAYEAHAREDRDGDKEGLADIGELRLSKALAALKGDDFNWARQVIGAMKLRAGLLLERAPEVFTFPHRTFQEYLAGAHLAAQPDLARRAAALAAGGEAWRQVILLAVGRLVYLSGDIDRPLALVGELCPARAADDEVGWRQAWLAGDALREMGVDRVRDSALGRDLLARVQERLAALLTRGRLAPRQRAGAGRVLALLGDPRREVLLPEAMAFCHVPAGPFWMGSPDEDEMGYDFERPLHRVEMPYDYWLARYPVTVAQFRAFVEAEGLRPGDPDSLRDPDNHPVRWVNWHEARAFCAWLTERLCESASQRIGESVNRRVGEGAGGAGRALWEGLAAGRLVVRLPSEAEWEKGARGGIEIPSTAPGASPGLVQNPDPRRRYPWGGDPDPGRANYYETRIGSTSAVGMFPGGASPYGCLDMAGNVWEWTTSLWGEDWQKPEFEYPYDPSDGRENLEAGDRVCRVLRGGAFVYYQWSSRCTFRDDDFPDLRLGYSGFRVVAAPSPPSPPSGPSALGHSGKSALRRERSERPG